MEIADIRKTLKNHNLLKKRKEKETVISEKAIST